MGDDEAAEAALRRSEERYRSLVENLPASVVILFDRDLRILLVDGPEVEASGSSKQAMEGKLPYECLPPEFARVVEANWRRVLAGERFSMELPWEDKHYQYEYVPVRDRHGAIEYGLVVGQNVTERYRSEQRLRESEARFRTLFEAAPDAYVIHDLQGRLVDGNPAAEQLFHVTRDDVRGKSFHEFISFDPGSLPTVMAAMARSLAGEPSGPEIVRCTRKDNVVLDVELKTVPMQLDNQQVILVATRDVTERVRAGEIRRQLESQLHHAMKMEAVGRLAGGIAHDFNNVLTAIMSNVEYVAEQLDVGDRRRADLEEALGAVQRASTLVAQLLAFSRKPTIVRSTCELDAVVQNTTRLITRLLGETVTLAVETTTPATSVPLDAVQLEQILINLAVNARDAMPKGGELRFATRIVEITADDRADAKPGSYAVVTVSDTGVGMSEATLNHAFEPFFTTKPVGQGTGLGLSTAYGIITSVGGFMRAQSQLGAGTTFELYLPIVSGVSRVPLAAQPSHAHHGSESVLVVEDDEAVLRVIERGLRRHGFAVYATSNVDDAIAYARDQTRRIDLLVTDLIMPTLDGVALHDKLVSLRPGLRVLFVSGYAEPAILTRANRTTRSRFLSKPFTIDELLSRVHDVLDGS